MNTKMPKLSEWHIYGNEQQGRFTVRKPDAEPLYYLDVLTTDVTNQNFFRILDKKQYELKDHLGNVRVAIGDMKIPTNVRGIAPFVVDEKSVRDYYPGGMPIQDRTWQLNDYRYGFNKGSEIDKEIYAGEGRALTTLFREGDTYTQRWWSKDPKASEQPWQSSYNYLDGNPIWHNDPFGDETPTCSMTPKDQALMKSINTELISRYGVPATQLGTGLFQVAGIATAGAVTDGLAAAWLGFELTDGCYNVAAGTAGLILAFKNQENNIPSSIPGTTAIMLNKIAKTEEKKGALIVNTVELLYQVAF